MCGYGRIGWTMEPLSVKEEAELMREQTRRQAAGRVVINHTAEEWEQSRKDGEAYYKEKKEFDSIVNPPPKLKGRKASDRIPFL